MNRRINKVAVLGSGIMGSRIACHFANIGVEVLLLDMLSKEAAGSDEGDTAVLVNKAVRNRIVNQALDAAVKSNPSPIYTQRYSAASKREILKTT